MPLPGVSSPNSDMSDLNNTDVSVADEESPSRADVRGRSRYWFTIGTLFAMFLTYSQVQANIPGVNEPHYLTKARHVWDPSWCADDLFLQSSNPHLVFYRTVGWLAYVFPFPVAAILGRVLAYGLLAVAWVRLCRVLFDDVRVATVSAAFFLLLASLGNWSGEWLVGGVESKVFAYGFAFAGLSYLLECRVAAAGSLLGSAVSFHPVVGGWFTVCSAILVVIGCLRILSIPDQTRVPLRAWALGAAAFAATAAPGLIPAFAMLSSGDPEQAAEATRYQVTVRLAHHLDPTKFGATSHARFCATILSGALLLFVALSDRTAGRVRALAVIVAAAVLIAGVGVVIGWQKPVSDRMIGLLKFYPFRLADVLVPWFCAALLSRLATQKLRFTGSTILVLAAFAGALWIANPTRDSSRMRTAVRESWGDTCWWIRTNTSADALVLAPETDWAVKWFSQRAEYVNYKDCPQDPPSIAEFRRRRRVLWDWSTAATKDKMISKSEVAELHSLTEIDYFIAWQFGPFETEPVYSNEHFRVYDLRP